MKAPATKENNFELSRQLSKSRDNFSRKSARATANRLESVMRLVVVITDQVETNPVKLLEFGFAIDEASTALEYYYLIAEAKQFKFWNIFAKLRESK